MRFRVVYGGHFAHHTGLDLAISFEPGDPRLRARAFKPGVGLFSIAAMRTIGAALVVALASGLAPQTKPSAAKVQQKARGGVDTRAARRYRSNVKHTGPRQAARHARGRRRARRRRRGARRRPRRGRRRRGPGRGALGVLAPARPAAGDEARAGEGPERARRRAGSGSHKSAADQGEEGRADDARARRRRVLRRARPSEARGQGHQEHCS